MIPIKTFKEIEKMKKAGKIAADVKILLESKVQAGVTTLKLDTWAEREIRKKGAIPSFKGYQDFPATLCTCLNEEVVHCIPRNRKLKKGDLLTVDLGVCFQGLHVDTAFTMEVGSNKRKLSRKDRKTQFIKLGEYALCQAIKRARSRNRVGDISAAIQRIIEKEGYEVIRAFAGHGVGRKLHEPPQIPCFGEKGIGEILQPGMVLAVEVMYTQGSCEVEVLDDGWSVVTRDRRLAAMFEETVLVRRGSPLVLTR